ncbi:Uu.00g009650.m01.CDS01 [Anthostomella pinea]|uniref:Uu.00g009650.m01.CDS01 n=1 Tax=Anthostomella pinea TaxID=933095 RepID=A0AAI8YQ27_9PEZI|nr:Uu.00g009650.m01.CDS01 [Anthostomella pinea]
MIISLLLSSVLGYLVWTVVCLEANVRKARALQVPVVRIPFSAESNTLVIFQPVVWAALSRCLPSIPWSSYPDFVRFSHRNWHFLEKSRPTERFGPVWVLVSPAGISLHVADPDAIVEIYSRWRAFVRPVQKYVGMGWNSAPNPGDAARLGYQTPSKITSLEGDLRALTFNVLSATAFQEPRDLKSGSPHAAEHELAATASYRDTLLVVLESSILLMLIPYRHLTGALVPKSLARVGRAAASFKSILMKVVTEETAVLDRDSSTSGGLLTPLVRSLKPLLAAANEDVASRAKRGGLSADEILGNTFAINFAGHDTILIALSFALTLLVANPDIQEWLHEESVAVAEDGDDGWHYSAFAKLNRCHAVILETLRLFAPITGLPKIASERARELQVGDRVIPVPPGIGVFPVLLGIQTDARYWGTDPYQWRPSRWILNPGTTTGDERLLVPRKGTFFPWSDGPQNCVGKKLSMVEGVAVLARLFHRHRLRVERGVGETDAQARERTRDCADDVNYNLLLRMNHPERLRLVCEKRE